MRPCAVFLAFAAVAVSAQQNYTSVMDMKVDPNTVEPQTRANWCRAQTDTCSILCGDETAKNECSVDTLAYACSCRSNNSAPGLQYYTQTMPTFICNELFGQCNKQKVRDAQGQQACIQNIRNRCGTVNPPKSPVKSDSNAGENDKGNTSASSSSTPTAGGSSGNASPSQSSDGSNAVTTSSSRGVAAPTMVQAGHGAAAAAAFGLLAYLA